MHPIQKSCPHAEGQPSMELAERKCWWRMLSSPRSPFGDWATHFPTCLLSAKRSYLSKVMSHTSTGQCWGTKAQLPYLNAGQLRMPVPTPELPVACSRKRTFSPGPTLVPHPLTGVTAESIPSQSSCMWVLSSVSFWGINWPNQSSSCIICADWIPVVLTLGGPLLQQSLGPSGTLWNTQSETEVLRVLISSSAYSMQARCSCHPNHSKTVSSIKETWKIFIEVPLKSSVLQHYL